MNKQVKVKNNDNIDNLRPNRTRSNRSTDREIRISLGRYTEEVYQQPKQKITNNIPLANTASGEGNILRAQRNICQDNEEQLLPILFDIPAEGRGQFMTTAQISERLVSYGNIKKPMSMSQLGMLLGRHGYRAVTRGGRNTRVRGWIVYQRDTEEINANKRLIAQECVTV